METSKRVTLTFDNGPDPEVTPFVLEVLARHGIKVTFFVIGEKLRDSARRRLCEIAHGDGHWIGNHTFNHLTPLGLSRYRYAHRLEIARTQELIGELAHPLKLFRPFGGGGHLNKSLLNARCLDYLVEEKFTCVLWNSVPRDWENPEGWVDEAVRQSRNLAWPLVVLHDLQTEAMSQLEVYITRMKDEGATFVQGFPPDSVPIREGKIILPIEDYVSNFRST